MRCWSSPKSFFWHMDTHYTNNEAVRKAIYSVRQQLSPLPRLQAFNWQFSGACVQSYLQLPLQPQPGPSGILTFLTFPALTQTNKSGILRAICHLAETLGYFKSKPTGLHARLLIGLNRNHRSTEYSTLTRKYAAPQQACYSLMRPASTFSALESIAARLQKNSL